MFFSPTLTAERGSSEEVCATPAASTSLRLLLRSPSADKEADAPSRAAMASTQTPRLPMSVNLAGEKAKWGYESCHVDFPFCIILVEYILTLKI